MEIEAKEFKIKMTHNELYNTTYDIRSCLICTINNHWVNHQSNWKEQEKDRLTRLREMSLALGMPDIYESVFIEAVNIFAKFNEKRNTIAKAF